MIMKKRQGENKEEATNGIVDILKEARREMRANLPLIRDEVEEIITLKEKNGARIEQHLDTLLGCMQMGIGEREFNMLNEYYKGIDKEGYEFYKKEYEKLYN